MAANLQILKRRIRTAKNIAQIAKAMEMISASKIKRAQDAVAANKPYADRIEILTTSLLQSTKEDKYTHPLLEKNDSENTLLLVISPDKGLCGSLPANLLKKTLNQNDSTTRVVSVGRKAEQFSASRNLNLDASFPMGTTIPSFATAITLKDLVVDEFLKKNVSRVSVIYTTFESFFVQTPVVKQILPITVGEHKMEDTEEEAIHDYKFEPNPQQILNSLLPYYVETQIYHALIEAYTSEQAARMMAMQNAKNSAHDIADYLTLSYNKVRQERITNEILDLNNSKLV